MRHEPAGRRAGGLRVALIAGAIVVLLLAFAAYAVFKARIPLTALPSDGLIDLSVQPDKPNYFVSGWSIKEPMGVWSAGKKTTLTLPIGLTSDAVPVAIDVNAFLPNSDYVQHVPVSVRHRLLGNFGFDTKLTTWTFDAQHQGGMQIVSIPAKQIKHGIATLAFSFPDATSPADQQLSTDGRKLGIFVRSIRVGGAGRPPVSPPTFAVLAPGAQVNLSKQLFKPLYFASGWAAKEPSGIWSGGKEAVLSLPVAADAKILSVVLEVDAFLPNQDYVQHVTVKAGDLPIANWIFDSTMTGGTMTLSIPAGAVKNGVMTLNFSLPDATSPAEQKVSSDPRRLALFVKSVAIAK